jgi:hypothetical protein
VPDSCYICGSRSFRVSHGLSMSEKMTNQGSLELSTKQQARFGKYLELSVLKLFLCQKLLWSTQVGLLMQILDINLPCLWAWVLLPSKVSMWIFLYNLIEIHYSLSPHIICEVSMMLWRWQVHDICQGHPCVQSENVNKRKLGEDVSATFLPTVQQMKEHMHQWHEDPS